MTKHVPVLLKESVEALNLHEGQIFVDGTLGSGGHSAEVLRRFGDAVEIIGLDRDKEAIVRTGEILNAPNVFLRNESFRNIDRVLSGLGISKVDAILLDLGISSNQIEESGRGFSFLKDEPLLMTMESVPGENSLTAKVILNTWDEGALELILRGFGEEKFSRRIAREIVARREVKPFETTFELVEAIKSATPSAYHRGRIHPATKTFQALRIAVNEELTALGEGLEKGFELLNSKGRLVIISFHSLEDRIVKNFFRDMTKVGRGKALNKKPIQATDEEMGENPRSRSAKLRVIEKI
ncbi:MAG: 16S rRNA (cytosine(1402)-N(4))-methyltransferase RsmH [Minisyncoccota bacterium]